MIDGIDMLIEVLEQADKNIYYIERIERVYRKYALVKWIGYDERTWEPINNIKNTLPYKQYISQK